MFPSAEIVPVDMLCLQFVLVVVVLSECVAAPGLVWSGDWIRFGSEGSCDLFPELPSWLCRLGRLDFGCLRRLWSRDSERLRCWLIEQKRLGLSQRRPPTRVFRGWLKSRDSEPVPVG